MLEGKESGEWWSAQCLEYDIAMQAKQVADLTSRLAERDHELARLKDILIAILHADARGQGLPFQEAMNHAHAVLTIAAAKEANHGGS